MTRPARGRPEPGGVTRHYPAPVPVDPAGVDHPDGRPDGDVAARDLLRAVVPFVAAGVVVYAAVTDPAHPARIAALGGAAILFALWAVRPDRMPTLVLTAGVLVAVVLAKGSGDLDVGLFLVSLVAIVAAGWELSRTAVVIAVAAALATPVLIGMMHPGDVDIGIWLVGVAFPALMSWLFRRQEELRIQLEESRRQLVARSVSEERQRIARDVHDLVGHGLAAVLLQVAGARHVLRRDPDEADVALAAAEDTGRRSLGELRATVALLRADGEDAVSAVPGLADLPRLVEDARASGLAVDCVTTGDLRRTDPMSALTVYRIAQEALLNAARHAPRARTGLAVSVGDEEVDLRVESRPVTPVAGGRQGYGLTGMRERAAAVGGTLRAGPHADGWLVHCVIPLAGARSGSEP